MTADLSPERRARLVLNRVGEPGHHKLLGLVAGVGPVAALRYLSRKADDRSDDLVERIAVADPEADLAEAAAQGIRFVTPEDREWPTTLGDLDRGPVLYERGGSPLGLWVRGPNRLDDAVARSVAIVGSRSATTYGVDASFRIAAGVGGAGVPVISGAAFGIDFAAHRGALSSPAPTVAVLACGADRVYPAAHRDLLERIAETGLVVSEAPLGGDPLKVRFLARNRLIAAFSTGTVVVEAALRSGALNTANWAAGLGRVVMGVPGAVTSAPSAGVHELIRNRNAVLVTSADDVVEAVAPIGTHLGSKVQAQQRASS